MMMEHFALYWNEWVMSFLCMLIASCCFLRINHLPRAGSTAEKLTMYFMGLGAFGLMISPFCGYLSDPNFFELLFVSGAVIVGIRMTREEWAEIGEELPVPALARKGVATEEEDACYR